jgi:transcriptional regulator with XRE-family HTH domain
MLTAVAAEYGGTRVREPDASGQARSELGAELAAYRRAAGLSQAKLAEFTEFSRSTVANVETGRQHVPRTFWERADGALRTGGVLANAHDEIEAATSRDLRTAARDMSAARHPRTWQHHPDTPLHEPSAEQTSSTSRPGPASVSPLPADLEQPSSPSAEATVPLQGLRPGQDTSIVDRNGSRPVSPGDVARLQSMRQHLKAIDNAHGGGAALPMADGYLRREIAPLLNGSHRDPGSRNLIEVVAEFQHDVGWMAYDASQQRLATAYFTRALRSAHAAGNRLLGARILAAMSHQAVYLGHLRQAIDFAQAARAATRHVATPRTVAMLAAMEACAHAAAGDARQCHKALDEAANAVSLITSGQPEPEWLDFDEGGYWGHAARAYRDLDQPRKAEEYAQRSVGLCLLGHSRTHAQRNAIQATAHLHMGEIDAAAAAAEQVVREAWNLHSGHVFEEVTQLTAAIDQSATPAARDFLEQARELLNARGPRPDTKPAS